MIRLAFENLIAGNMAKIMKLNRDKGKDYAGDLDVTSNFARQAQNLGLTPEQVWAVYTGKHWDAVMSYCKHGKIESEPIQSRILDIILYMFLLLALIEDKK